MNLPMTSVFDRRGSVPTRRVFFYSCAAALRQEGSVEYIYIFPVLFLCLAV